MSNFKPVSVQCSTNKVEMEAKRQRLSASLISPLDAEKLDLKIWQNIQLSKCYDDNYINR